MKLLPRCWLLLHELAQQVKTCITTWQKPSRRWSKKSTFPKSQPSSKEPFLSQTTSNMTRKGRFLVLTTYEKAGAQKGTSPVFQAGHIHCTWKKHSAAQLAQLNKENQSPASCSQHIQKLVFLAARTQGLKVIHIFKTLFHLQ